MTKENRKPVPIKLMSGSLVLANTKSNQSGFTIIEINMSLVITGIIIVSILSVFTNYFVILTRNGIDLEMNVNAQNLLRSVSEEIRYGAGVRQTNTVTDTYSPVGGWNTSNANFVIITAIPALTPENEYIIDPDTGSPYFNEYVYYKSGSTLYKRLLAHPMATDNKIKTTCPPASVTPTCPADIKLTENVNTMSFVLYDQDNNTITDPLLARSITINLNMLKDTFGAPITLDANIRTTLRNVF